jgi:hypothetical protein
MENIGNINLNDRLELHKQEYLKTHKSRYEFPKSKHIGRGKGTFVERELFESPAFIALVGVAPQMLIYILGKREMRQTSKSRICVNANELKLSYIELEKLGITQPRATRGFDELLAKGFIRIEHHGGGCQKDQSIYSLSNQYLLWKKGLVFSKRPKALKKGFLHNKRQIQHTKP